MDNQNNIQLAESLGHYPGADSIKPKRTRGEGFGGPRGWNFPGRDDMDHESNSSYGAGGSDLSGHLTSPDADDNGNDEEDEESDGDDEDENNGAQNKSFNVKKMLETSMRLLQIEEEDLVCLRIQFISLI